MAPNRAANVAGTPHADGDGVEPFRVIGGAKTTESAYAPVRRRAMSARVASAAAIWGVCWAAAIPLALVPVVHLFAVPGLLFGGVIGAVLCYRHRGSMGPAQLSCPDCGAEVTLTRRGLEHLTYVVCSQCGQHLALEHAQDDRR